MTLRPVERAAETTHAPSYPARRAEVLRRVSLWARRAGAVALASASIWFAGCDLLNPTMGGDIATPWYFTCAEGEYADVMSVPGTYTGNLCDQGKFGWSSIDIPDTTIVEVSLDGEYLGEYVLDAAAHVIDPTGLVVAEVRAGDGAVAVEMTPGTWRVAIIPGPTASDYEYFMLTLEQPAGE